MRSPNIRGDAAMKISYNVEKEKVENRGGWREGGGRPLSPEMKMIMSFLESDKDNICFTYETDDECLKRKRIIAQSVSRKKIPVKVSKRGTRVFIERK